VELAAVASKRIATTQAPLMNSGRATLCGFRSNDQVVLTSESARIGVIGGCRVAFGLRTTRREASRTSEHLVGQLGGCVGFVHLTTHAADGWRCGSLECGCAQRRGWGCRGLLPEQPQQMHRC
jgi:hypothetical protein